jgi:hypothetical protein
VATIQLEAMSVGRIFDRAFLIYRNNFLCFITIAAIIYVPLTLVSIASTSWIRTRAAARQQTFAGQTTPERDSLPTARPHDTSAETTSSFGLLGEALTLLLENAAVMLCAAALIQGGSERYRGDEITVGQAYQFILPKSWTLIGAAVLVGLMTTLGFILFVVPGVILGLWFFLTTSAIVVEGHSATDGMARSKALVAGNLGKVFGVGLLSLLIVNVISLSVGYFAIFVGKTVSPDSATLNLVMRYLASTLSHILVMPISAAAAILLYYDLRIRKEGFDLQMLAQSMTSGQGELRAA